MDKKRELLNEVSNTVAMQSFILSRELSDITSQDLYKIAVEMENSIATLLLVAQKMKTEEAA
jgi:hypothetical protein